MKKVVYITLVACFSFKYCAAQTVKANVRKIEGIPVYVLNEPESEYTVVGKVSDQDVSSVLNAISGTPTIK